MSWLLLALSLAIFCVAWSVHSPVLMVLCLLAALAALVGFAWLRYKLLFPERAIVMNDTPLTADDVRRMREAQMAASTAPVSLPATSNPDLGQLRAAGERVAERDALLQQQQEAQRRIAEMERRAAEAEQRAADMAQRLVDLQQREAQPAPMQQQHVNVSNQPTAVETAPAAATPPALPPKPQPNLRDEGWNPYAGVVDAPAKRAIDPKATGLDVPMLTPLRDEPDPT